MSDTPKPMSETFNLSPGSFVRHIKEVEASGMSAEEVSMMGGIEGVLRFRLEQVAQLKDQLSTLQARYDADMAMMNQRLIEQDANYLRRLQAKTQREGFVPVDVVEKLVDIVKAAYWVISEQTGADRPPFPKPKGVCACNHCSECIAMPEFLLAIETVQPYLNPNKEP